MFISFSAFSLIMLFFIGFFTWMSYQAGREASAQKILSSAVQEWLADPDAPLPDGGTISSYMGEDQLPERFRENLDRFEDEDYEIALQEWNEIQLWRGTHPETGQEVFIFLELGSTADDVIFAPNLQRSIFFGSIVVLLGALTLGYLVSRRLSRPIQQLTEDISTSTPYGDLPPLADRYSVGEAREVATAFDSLQTRLQQFADRERRFTRDSSHELRTPLTLMRSATQILRRSLSEPEPKQQRALDHLDQGVTEMTQSIDSFLYLARERELQPGTMEEDPGVIVRSILHAQETQYQLPPERLVFRQNGSPVIHIPVDMFRIVAGNLIRNALQHGGDGAVHILLSDKALIVEDQGLGLPQEVKEQLGKPFPKGPQTEGTGLGLSIVHDVADRAGWKVRWEAPPHGGTRAVVEFL